MSTIPQKSHFKKKKTKGKEKTAELEEIRSNGNKMQCGILDWVLELRKGMSGKTGEIQIKPFIVVCQFSFISFPHWAVVVKC